ncbi:MAG TPA: DUF6602 domain-containing protein [Halalkalibaculum sp.]|nr:DUF6602 domain-containing protein [Halalkalibaculum sp.]
MLKSHMDACEQHLLSISQVPANSGHSLHKGTPREAFIKAYLESHLPSNVAIGTGEIIDANSKPGQQRNQYDIVIYKRSYPKLDFGGGISGFLVESVIATIEVKSSLDKSEFTNAAKAAYNSKQLTPNVVSSFHTGYIPPGIINLIVAYDGPASMKTVHGWVSPVYSSESIPQATLPQSGKDRIGKCADAIDAVFVLGKGFMYFDNLPFGFADDQMRQANPSMKWILSDTNSGNLLLLFLILQGATANIEGKWLNAIPYLSTFQVPGLQWGA